MRETTMASGKTPPSTEDGRQSLDRSISAATDALLAAQRPDGYWLFELEADATIPAEYVLLRHYLGEPVDAELEGKIANYLRRIQARARRLAAVLRWRFRHERQREGVFRAEDDWRRPRGGPHAPSARGDPRNAAARRKSNVFTRALLALYGVVSWRAVPVMPVEIMLLPYWFPLHLNKMSYWARTVIAPLLVLGALKPRARNPKQIGVDELFLEPPRNDRPRPQGAASERAWSKFFTRRRRRLARCRTAFSQAIAPARHRRGRDVRQGASQRRRRSWGDFSRHGQFGDDVRRAGPRSSGSGLPRCAPRNRQASHRQFRAKPIANPAFPRCGTRPWRAKRCWRSATSRRWRRPPLA